MTSLLLSFLILGLYVSLSLLDTFYTTLIGVITVNTIQQSLQIILTYILSTDVGFCCPGVTYTRWFLHQDFYTKVIDSIVNVLLLY